MEHREAGFPRFHLAPALLRHHPGDVGDVSGVGGALL